jgi:hypothetical protein
VIPVLPELIVSRLQYVCYEKVSPSPLTKSMLDLTLYQLAVSAVVPEIVSQFKIHRIVILQCLNELRVGFAAPELCFSVEELPLNKWPLFLSNCLPSSRHFLSEPVHVPPVLIAPRNIERPEIVSGLAQRVRIIMLSQDSAQRLYDYVCWKQTHEGRCPQ